MLNPEFKATARELVSALQRDRSELVARLQDIDRKLEAFNVILEESPTQSKESGVQLPLIENPSSTQAAREILRAAGIKGLLPRELREALRAQGITVTNQLASNILFRLKTKTKETVQVLNRHYWRGFEPTREG